MNFLVLIFLSLSLIANTIESQIVQIEPINLESQDALLYLANGKVLKIDSSKYQEISELINENQKSHFVIHFDQNRMIEKIEVLKKISDSRFFKQLFTPSTPYVPTTILDISTAKMYHREGRRYEKDSQCFNRAMIWSYEWWIKHQLKSMKIFIFFSRNYIRRYNFEWWFHVAPYVHVYEDGKVVERVMDLKYTSRPLPFREWTDIFMRNDAKCTIIDSYSSYADFPYYGDCFLQRTHMFTYQPADLQMYEAWGYEKFEFNLEEVKGAYLEAFDIDFSGESSI